MVDADSTSQGSADLRLEEHILVVASLPVIGFFPPGLLSPTTETHPKTISISGTLIEIGRRSEQMEQDHHR